MAGSSDWLDRVAREKWLLARPDRIVSAHRSENGDFAFGDVVVAASELAAFCPASADVSQTRHLTLLHDGWRIADLHLFRPLVYFAAFGQPEIFTMLEVALRSSCLPGLYQGDVAVLTEPQRVEALQRDLAFLGFGSRLHVLPCEPCIDLVDWCMARFRIADHPLFARHQPLLYLDVDVVIDRPIEALLMELARSRLIHCCAEWQLDEHVPDTDGQWFGYPLLSADRVPVDPYSPGFSAGVIGYANPDVVDTCFKLVLRSAEAYARKTGIRRPFAGTDQSFAGYVFRKLGFEELSLLTHYLRLYRIDPDHPQLPEPSQAKGMVHFLNAPYAVRIGLMRQYLDLVSAGCPG